MTHSDPTPIATLLAIMARLRDPDGGCPWDLEQSFETIAPYTLEEAYEVDHAIRTKDMEGLCDELGDLLLQVVFHAQMAKEAGLFAFDDVARAIGDKLVRRHPHVFGDPERGGELTEFERPEDFSRFWEESKAREREGRADSRAQAGVDPFEGIPIALPALMRAVKLRKRARRLDPSPAGANGASLADPVLEQAFRSTVDRAKQASESEHSGAALIGALLLRCVDAARVLGVDPEDALRRANAVFEAQCKEEAAS
ncbi:MAG: nucleoside triphosphate pyrophosphohydrolase [bacterium]|nr:nucleoside triphosphate pyrophosphohydrolase [bacterium]MCP5039862.1 nucleoside triphosphate pyrophosphohydrolase [bacterium]